MHDEPTPAPIRIPLRDKTGAIVDYAIIDASDATLALHRWCRNGAGYAVRGVARDDGSGQRHLVRLHRVILGLTPGDGLQGDHINGDRLDCRRANLRAVDHASNHQNVRSRQGSSLYRGVSWNKRRARWQAYAELGAQRHHLGYFDTEADAAEAASAWRLANMPYTNEQRADV